MERGAPRPLAARDGGEVTVQESLRQVVQFATNQLARRPLSVNVFAGLLWGVAFLAVGLWMERNL